MKNIIGVLLIVLSIGLGFTGINKVSNSGAKVEIVGVELSASDEGQKTMGYIFIGLAIASLVVGGKIITKKS